MDTRSSAGSLWRGAVLLVAGLTLTACAAEVAEVQPTPSAPVISASASPAAAEVAAPAPSEPQPVVSVPPPAEPAPVQSESPEQREAQPAPAPPPAPAERAEVVSSPAAPAAAAGSPVEITGVEVRDVPSGGLQVEVTADGAVPAYESFTLPDPPRLVVDISNATHAIRQPIAAHPPVITAIRSSQYREGPVKIVRVVFDLRAVTPYRVAATENHLRVEINTVAAAAADQAPAVAPAAVPAPFGKVTRVDLQRTRGRQRILIGTSGSVKYQVQEGTDPASLSIEVSGATLEPAAARTLDLKQVASPVLRLAASQYKTDPEPVVRVVADLRMPVRYEVQQTASGIQLELLAPPQRPAPRSEAQAAVSPPAPAPAVMPGTSAPDAAAAATPAMAVAPAPEAAAASAAPAKPSPGLGRLSMDFKDADIANLLRIIAEVSGMNVVSGSDVTGKVTVRLVNVDWQQALDVILKINGMGYEIDGNIIRVAPLAKLDTERRARDEAKKREEETRMVAARSQETEKQVQVALEPIHTDVVPVNYSKASDLLRQLDRFKTPRRTDVSITADDRTNRVVIQETASTIEKMRNVIRELDRPTPQVLIEARLVEATRNFSQSLGIEWGGLTTPGSTSIFTSALGTPIAVPSNNPVPLAVSYPSTSSAASALGIITGGMLNNRLNLSLRLSAGETEGKIRTLSAPKIATVDNQEAEIKQGQQVPYTTVDSSGRTVIAFLDAFIRLKVTPHITNDRRISMKVEAERSFPGDQISYTGGFVFPVNTRKATTNVLVSNGSTIVIGGLLQSDDEWTEPRVPWLSKMPVLGMLFKSTTISNSKVELLIFLTPTILEETKMG